MANFSGNGSKSLVMSVEASLEKLQTKYIDLVSPSLYSGRHSGWTLADWFPSQAIYSLVGLQHIHSGTDAILEPLSCFGQGIVPRRQRYSSVDCEVF
jgi:hypothetical protein